MNKMTDQNPTKASSSTEQASSAQATPKTPHQSNAAVTPQQSKSAGDKAITSGAKQSDVVKGVKKDPFNGKWTSQIQAAKNNWGKLSEQELINSGGVEAKLTDLVQQRYSLSQDTARQQVKSFIDKCHC